MPADRREEPLENPGDFRQEQQDPAYDCVDDERQFITSRILGLWCVHKITDPFSEAGVRAEVISASMGMDRQVAAPQEASA